MITDFILNAVFSGINALLSLMPSITLPSITDGHQAFIVSIMEVNRIFPVYLAVIFFGVYITIRIALQGWDFVMYVYHQFWGSE